MRHGRCPQTLHVDEPTPHVDWDGGRVACSTERGGLADAGDARAGPRLLLRHQRHQRPPHPRAGPGPGASRPRTEAERRPPLAPWPLSAEDPRGPGRGRRRPAAHLRQTRASDPADVGHSLATTRARFKHRAVVLAADRDDCSPP